MTGHQVRETASLRQTMYRVLETYQPGDVLSRVVDVAIILLICASVTAVILESIESIEIRYSTAFFWFELTTVSIFSVEYLLRIWSCVEAPPGDGPARGAFMARIRLLLQGRSWQLVDMPFNFPESGYPMVFCLTQRHLEMIEA